MSRSARTRARSARTRARCAGTRARRSISRSLFAVPALLVLFAGPLLAQEGWDQIEPAADSAPATSLGPLSLGIEAGKPLIFGIEAGYNFTQYISGEVGFSTLSRFTAISGELRLYPLGFPIGQAVPSIGAGFTQYFLSADGGDVSPIAAHGVAGLEYIFPSRLGVGATLGYQLGLGGSEDRSIERYGIHDDLANWFFAMNARYFF